MSLINLHIMLNHICSFQKTSIPPPQRKLEFNSSDLFGCPITLSTILLSEMNFPPPPPPSLWAAEISWFVFGTNYSIIAKYCTSQKTCVIGGLALCYINNDGIFALGNCSMIFTQIPPLSVVNLGDLFLHFTWLKLNTEA